VRTVIFNADDYGLTPAVSAGILAAGHGVVRSTTVMANFVTEADARALSASGLGCGAHLNLSTGLPLTDYPAHLLKADGTFNKAIALEASTWESAEHRSAAVAEWTAQLGRLRDLGLSIGHLDSHHHSHMLGRLFAEALRFAWDAHLPLRCRPLMRDYAAAAGVRSPDDFLEGYFGYNFIDREALLAALATARGEVVEVMCHPGRVDAQLRAISSYVEEREAELEVLGQPELAAELEQMGWRLAGYAVLSSAA
jgi:chitin disaccharide deacetylase